jgi:uncharacterized protein YoxC
VTAIYHLNVQIIGRSSGRSAVGSAAYRAAEKLKSVEAAAYRSGQDLGSEGNEITHDYTRKKGVVHKEILLPDNAPKEYEDRQTLWRAVEAKERRRDARLAREIEVALQIEFDLEEQKALLREYIRENFVDKGMIADFAVHNKGNGNPHAHIMLTTRHVTPDGFEGKNRDWDEDTELLKWRENWAVINNRKFEEKGLDARIDHRSYKAQGIDREPTIHLGYEVAALEKKGIRTERGDLNREISRRNAERAQKAERKQELTESATNENPAIEESPVEKTAQTLSKLREDYITLEKNLAELIAQRNEIREEIPRLNFRTENMDEHAQNIETLQGRIAELQENRQNLNFLQWTKKQETDQAIKQTEQEARRAEIFFKNRFNVDPAQAPDEIKRIHKIVREKETDLNTKNAAILDIMNTQDKILLEYHTQKLLAQTRPDSQQIDKLLEQMNTPPETIRDRLLHERIDRRLNIIPDENFKRVIEKLPATQAQTLIDERNRAQEKKLEKLREQTKTRDLSRSR